MTSLAERFYEPVKTGLARSCEDEAFDDDDFDWSDLAIYGVRERGMQGGRILASELRLSWQKADLLCDLLEVIRAASGTEAQRATTVKQGVVHDGPVPERQTPITPCNQTTP